MNKMDMKKLKIRFATKDDVELILEFIRALADYENVLDHVTATKEILLDSLFEKNLGEVIIGEYEEKPIAFALFHHSLAGFSGRPGLYLEDIFVYPEMRGKGIGSAMFKYLALIAKDRGYCRLALLCLDWNKPSIEFYKKMGAVPFDTSTIFRIEGDTLDKLTKI